MSNPLTIRLSNQILSLKNIHKGSNLAAVSYLTFSQPQRLIMSITPFPIGHHSVMLLTANCSTFPRYTLWINMGYSLVRNIYYLMVLWLPWEMENIPCGIEWRPYKVWPLISTFYHTQCRRWGTPTQLFLQEVYLGKVLQLEINNMTLWWTMGKGVMDCISVWGLAES